VSEDQATREAMVDGARACVNAILEHLDLVRAVLPPDDRLLDGLERALHVILDQFPELAAYDKDRRYSIRDFK